MIFLQRGSSQEAPPPTPLPALLGFNPCGRLCCDLSKTPFRYHPPHSTCARFVCKHLSQWGLHTPPIYFVFCIFFETWRCGIFQISMMSTLNRFSSSTKNSCKLKIAGENLVFIFPTRQKRANQDKNIFLVLVSTNL